MQNPPPDYKELVADPQFFKTALMEHYRIMGIEFMPVRKIGGRDLDLHRLFVEVTSRGGSERVANDRKWQEVASVFNYSYGPRLKEHYRSLLLGFEKRYYLNAAELLPSNPGSSSRATATSIPTQGVTSMFPPAPQQAQTSATQLPAVGSSSAVTQLFDGVIDGEFDCGFLVTATVGTEQLKGVLYKFPDEQPVLQPGGATPTPGHQKRSEIKLKDPALQQASMSAYNVYYTEQYASLEPMYQGKEREMIKIIDQRWDKLEEPERAVYHEKAMKDRERYKIQMGDALLLPQIPAELYSNTVYVEENKDKEEEEGASSQGVANVDPNISVEEQPCKKKIATEENVRKESSTAGDDNKVFTSDSVMVKAKEMKEKASAQGVGNVDVDMLVEKEHCETSAVGEEGVRKECSAVSDDKEVSVGDLVTMDKEEKQDQQVE